MSSVNGLGHFGVGLEVTCPEMGGKSENCQTVEGEARSMAKDVRRSDASKESGRTSVPGAGDETSPAEGTGTLERSEECHIMK